MRNWLSISLLALLLLSLATPVLAQGPDTGLKAGEVKVLKRGVGERLKLRYTPSEGDAFTVDVASRYESTQEIAGMTGPASATPEVITTITITVDEVTSDNMITTSFVIDAIRLGADAGASPVLRSALETGMKSLVGTTATVRITDRGETEGLRFAGGKVPPAGHARQMLETMSAAYTQVTARFPEEAVGRGAEWRHTARVVQHGVTIDQETRYTLVKRSGEQITLDIAMTQTASDQEMDMAGAPAGLAVHLVEMTARNTGRTRLDLSRLAPQDSRWESSAHFEMSIDSGAGAQVMKQTITAEATVKVAE